MDALLALLNFLIVIVALVLARDWLTALRANVDGTRQEVAKLRGEIAEMRVDLAKDALAQAEDLADLRRQTAGY